MNDLTLLREAGPDAPPLSPAVRNAARAALLAEIDASPRSRTRPVRLPGRKVGVRLGIAAVAVAAAWAGAVAITAPGEPSESVTLVDLDTPTFPLSLDPEPAGMRPGFSGDAESADFAEYDSADGADRFTVGVDDEEFEYVEEAYANVDHLERARVEIDGAEGQLVRGVRSDYCDDGLTVCERVAFAALTWERREDQWVAVSGEGRYSRTAELVALAESLVDRPQPATLAAGLAPAGWSVDFYKMGRVLGLVNDSYEQETITLQVLAPDQVTPPDQLRDQLMGPVGEVVPVTVNARPAQLVLCESGYLDERIWFLQAQFEEGTTFTLQVPDSFTEEQVVQMAEQVTYSP